MVKISFSLKWVHHQHMKLFLPFLTTPLISLYQEEQRRLRATDIPYSAKRDYCKVGEDENGNIYGQCIPQEHFPRCRGGEFICYNRVNRRDKFWPDKQPHFYIDPVRILCFPNSFLDEGGCSSCTPGRWCVPEGRCILNSSAYKCRNWLWFDEELATPKSLNNEMMNCVVFLIRLTEETKNFVSARYVLKITCNLPNGRKINPSICWLPMLIN